MDPSEYVELRIHWAHLSMWIERILCGSSVYPCEYVEGRGDRDAVPLAGSVPASEAEVTRLSIEYHV